MNGTGQPSFHSATIQAIHPASHAAGNKDSDVVVDMLGYQWAEIIVTAGAAGLGSLVITAREGDSAAGSDDAEITGATLAAINSSNDNQAHTAELFVPPRKRYLTIRGAVADANVIFGVTVKLHHGRKKPDENPAPGFIVTT